MPQPVTKPSPFSLAQLFFAVVLAITFFLPWITWQGTPVKGSALATGEFFRLSEEKFTIGNPFPQFSFTFNIFWLIPALALMAAVFIPLKKKTSPFSYISAALALAQFTVFFVFTNFLFTGQSVTGMLKPAAYLALVAAAGLIFTTLPAKNWLLKICWLLAGPVIAYSGYKLGEKMIMSETHAATENIKADYTVTADALIREFISNDTATNKKYIDKVLAVNGNAAAVEIQADSTSTIKFADSTGSYLIFSLEKTQYERTKLIKAGDPVSLKGVCSGSIFSDILKTTAITFKRAAFNTTK
jgi:tRNA_anti-like